MTAPAPLATVAPNVDSTTAAAGRADVCTVAEVAAWLGVDRKTVYDAVNRRELPSARLGRRVLLSRAAINAWLAGRLR
ncbi:MAG: helix-turn-helix domain-containing protein [Deltaproteobacteria bacterium]|nr:helix-turn-helix domain-containing protein [Kofleriaceae bacterium]